MRVVITADAVGGVWQYATALSESLADDHGVQVLLVVCGPPASDAQLTLIQQGSRPGGGSIVVDHLDLPLEWAGASPDDYRTAQHTLVELALQWRAQVVHANEHYLGEIGASGLPVIVVSHSDLCSWRAGVSPKQPHNVDGGYIDRVSSGLHHASAVVAPSAFTANCLTRFYRYSGVTRIIPNGLREHLLPETPPARDVDAAMIGRLWDPAKNLACFQDAVAKHMRGTFVAAGPLAQPGQQPGAETPTMVGSLQLPGMLAPTEVRQLLARTSVVVSPSRYEPFGLVAVEAALAGCCLLLSDLPSYREVWGDTARYFEPTDASALRRALAALLDDAGARAQLAEAARLRAREMYTVGRMSAAYVSTYQRLALRYGLSL